MSMLIELISRFSRGISIFAVALFLTVGAAGCRAPIENTDIPKAADAHEDVLLPKLVCPDKTRVGELTTFIVSATDPDSKALQYQLRVSKQSGRVWTLDVGRKPASGKPCTYRNNFSVWGGGTFHVQARVSDGTTWSPWSEPRTIVCDD